MIQCYLTNFSPKNFLHIDASDLQLGTAIMQKGRLITYYSQKLNLDQRRYITMEIELLRIVKTLNKFKTISARVQTKGTYRS